MQVQTDFDVPRIHDPLNPANASHTAIIGDPRNDENLIVVQFHQAMLRFHNQVVDLLLLANFTGDIFVEAKKIVTHHYQWAVANDFLKRVCGMAAVNASLATCQRPDQQSVPHARRVRRRSLSLRTQHDSRPLLGEFQFPGAHDAAGVRVQPQSEPARAVELGRRLQRVLRHWRSGAGEQQGAGIDSVLANELENLPGLSGMMAVLATRNLRRGLALGLPSGQGMANAFGVAPMTAAQLTQGLPADEVAVLNANGGVLLKKTPLWYYVLRESAVLAGGNQLGPVGARIVTDTFVRMLKRDAELVPERKWRVYAVSAIRDRRRLHVR